MRLLVVTLATIENELEACLAAIARQTHTDFEHLVLRNLPKREAHEALYGTFMDRRDEFDLLVKVDADMVLLSDRLFEDVEARFTAEPALQVLSIAVKDLYTDRLVSGLNTYRNTVTWTRTGDRVFTDQFPSLHGNLVMDYTDLAPAASHCSDPHPFQAFHFGVHRGVKARVSLQRHMTGDYYTRYLDIARTWRHYLRHRDRRLALAVLGGELALGGHFSEDQLDYDNADVHAAFSAYAACDAGGLETEIRRARRATWGLLPSGLRMELLRGDWFSLPLRWAVPLELRERARGAVKGIERRLGRWRQP